MAVIANVLCEAISFFTDHFVWPTKCDELIDIEQRQNEQEITQPAFELAGSIGVFLGKHFCHKLAGETLRFNFAEFVLLIAFYLLWDNLPKLISL